MPGDERLPAACYSWSWHHDFATKQKLRKLKRDLTALQLAHLHDLSVRWIRAMDHATLTDSTIIRRFLPWDARGFGTEPASSPETDALWQEFTAGLVALTTRFEQAISPTEPLMDGTEKSSEQRTDRFVTAAMHYVEPWFAEQEAWEDATLPDWLPAIMARHCWRGKVGEPAPGGRPAPASAAAGPWFGAFRYTVDRPDADGTRRASIHIHNHTAPDSPFSDKKRMFGWFVEMVEHIKRHEPSVSRIGTATWLNNHPDYVAVFPPSYGAALTRGDGKAKGMSAWGQYIRSNLELNLAKADMLRSELRFSNHMLTSTVQLDLFESHVRREHAKAAATAPKL